MIQALWGPIVYSMETWITKIFQGIHAFTRVGGWWWWCCVCVGGGGGGLGLMLISMADLAGGGGGGGGGGGALDASAPQLGPW